MTVPDVGLHRKYCELNFYSCRIMNTNIMLFLLMSKRYYFFVTWQKVSFFHKHVCMLIVHAKCCLIFHDTPGCPGVSWKYTLWCKINKNFVGIILYSLYLNQLWMYQCYFIHGCGYWCNNERKIWFSPYARMSWRMGENLRNNLFNMRSIYHYEHVMTFI